MPPRMTTRSAGRPAATSRGEGTGGRTGRGGGRTEGRSGDQSNGRNEGQGGQVGGQGNQGRGQWNGRNQNGDAANDHIQGDVGNVIENNDRRGCTYKEFLACNPKEYDGMPWDDFKALTREKFCPSNEMQKLETKLWNYVMVEAGHAAYTDRFHELTRLVHHLVTLGSKRIERNGSIKQNPKKKRNEGEPSKDRNVRDGNKRTRNGNSFATTTNPVGRENTGTVPKCTTCNTHHPPGAPCRTCFNYNRPGYFAKDCRDVPRNVNPVNARNPTARECYECGSTDHIRGRAFMLGAEEARQDPNIMMDIEPSELGFSYEIEIASGQLREFDVIIGMDWLSNHKAEIICHEKVVRIPLLDGKMLRLLEEKPEEKMRQLMSAKAKEKNQEEIMVVRDFPEENEDELLEEIWKFGWWFEQDIDGESVDDSEKRLVMVSEEGWMS
nr:hypothetical protein [Tanacetum cinerariifolium]